ncbi:hypothetical protein BC830DRAFT_1120093 [Chytriomyces sp. MP71]|nr:hypothetical protein BC830DRAFT_1120093 [Chytriomyces sp. MP71]
MNPPFIIHATAYKPDVSNAAAYEVGWLFVQEYYTFLNKEPSKLHCFYNSKSSFIHGTEGDSLDTQEGVKEIQQRILELDFQDCKVLVSNVDSQRSHGGCIVIMVLGEMSNKGGSSYKFCQCFVLAEQPSGYFVYNDMFRFLKEDVDTAYDEPVDPMLENDYYNAQLTQQSSYQQQQIQQQQNHFASLVEQPASVTPTPAPVAAAPVQPAPRGRSPSPAKKQLTPTPAPAVPISAPAVAEQRPRSPSPAKVVATQETPAKVEPRKEEFSWADDSAPTPPAPTAAALVDTSAATSTPAPSSPIKAANKKKGQHQKESSSTPAPASATAVASTPAPAAPAKPKTWAGLVSATSSPAAATVVSETKTMNSKPSSESLKQPQQQRPASQQGKSTNGGAGGTQFVVKKVPNGVPPQAAPANEQGDDFREVQRGRGGGERRSGPRPSGDPYARSIFFMVPDGVDEDSIREHFSRTAGAIYEVMIPRGKSLCFVEFEEVSVAQAAIGKMVTINGKNITPEPRKPKAAVYAHQQQLKELAAQREKEGGQSQGGQRQGGQGSRSGYNGGHRGGKGHGQQQQQQQQQQQGGQKPVSA